MILNDNAVVLSRGNSGEYGRWAVLLTEGHGLLPVRFVGVNRSAGKLKAISEPMVWGEYRLFFSARSPAVHVTGGRIESTFPSLRADLSRTMIALTLCEMARRLAVERVPQPGQVPAALPGALPPGSKCQSMVGGGFRPQAPRSRRLQPA